ncbi:MAG: CRP/FNR family transcriptional regulator [Alphaproteobacteria bacterium]|jgi:CRP/FNR family transcriptional regulator
MATARIDIETRIRPVSLRPAYNPQPDGFNQNTKPATSGMQNDILDIARKHASDRRFVAAGAELFAEGETSDNLYVVLSGWLFQHRILEDGRRQILDFALPGAVLGYRAHPTMPFAFSAEAITPAEIAIIPLSRVVKLLHGGCDSAVTLLDAANEALLGAFDTLTDIGRRTAREAIAHFLLRMDRRIRRSASPDADGALPFPLNQEHIGDALGLTSVHVCRTLSKLRCDGLVETGRGHLRIIDTDALSEDAGVSYCEGVELRLAS